MVNIYVLELEGGNYYVGKTRRTFDRFDQHREGSGARWTKLHPVVGLYTFHKDRRDSDENMFTILMMKNFGIDKVRGGSWTNPEISDRSRKKLEYSRTFGALYAIFANPVAISRYQCSRVL